MIFFLVVFGKSKPKTPKKSYQSNKVKNRTSKIQVTITPPASNSLYMDDSIIDVGSQSHKISSDFGLTSKVPYWAHSYVYSYHEINYATKEQKKFYLEFKASFLNDVFLDIEENSNYAFILLFDLLNEFDIHKNISKLENQLNTLGEHYPKTKSYSITFLLKKMKEVGDEEGIERLRDDHYDYQSQVTYSTFEWRNRFKKALNLKKEETKLLDKIWFSSNTFSSIDYCCTEIIKLYINLIPKLDQYYKDQGTTIVKEFEEVGDIVVRKHFKYRKGSNNYKYGMEATEHEFYTTIFKYCENAVRENYGNKRKITIDPYAYTPEVKELFETRVCNQVKIILAELVDQIIPPDENTEIKLNQLNTTRWKIAFDNISSEYNSNAKEFENKIIELGNLNKENPSIENIFFEASKFIAKHDKIASLSLYMHYLYHDLKSATFDKKQHTKSIQKSLFATDEQFVDFQKIIDQFIKNKDFNKALSMVPSIYTVKRKKIKLDTSSIKEVQQQHSGTVALLNEYLKDDVEDGQVIVKDENSSQEEIQINIVQSKEDTTISIYSAEFPFTFIQTSTLEVFAKNNFSILQSELETFAKSNGAFKNQLIESINEICYERLDDLLIEEDEDYYTINQNYYHKLLLS